MQSFKFFMNHGLVFISFLFLPPQTSVVYTALLPYKWLLVAADGWLQLTKIWLLHIIDVKLVASKTFSLVLTKLKVIILS
jgi:hypothetical protein